MIFTLANPHLRLACETSSGGPPMLSELFDVAASRAWLTTALPLCVLSGDSLVLKANFTQTSSAELRCTWADPAKSVAVNLRLTLRDSALALTLAASGEAATIHAQMPWLSALFPDTHESEAERVILGADSFRDARNQPAMRRVQWALPCVRIGADGRALTLLAGDGSSAIMPEAAQLVSEIGFDLVLTSTPQTFVDAELVLHAGGWRAAFDLFRKRMRARYDLAQYARPDLTWYREQLVQHFTFLYGREILDLDTGQFDIDRFLDEGERLFGGYDGMLAWGAYPRIGIDERTQWDFYTDLPGGREGLRAMARRARERGVRFFVPFLPWDNSAALHGLPAEPPDVSLAQLVADVEADGVFLDTMSATGSEMRAALDEARPGVVFCSEGRPKEDAVQVITGSWDQSQLVDGPQGNWSPPREHMPGADLWRFVLPEHRQFVTSRHAQGDDRLRVIERGFFNATGWVVWQDIFGLALPWTPDEAGLLKKCRTLLREHRQAVWSAQPTPLIDTARAGIYANEFPAESKRLWTLYNETEAHVDGVVLRIAPRPNHHILDIWNDCEAGQDANGGIHARLAPHGLGAFVELPRLLAYADGVVSLAQPIPDASIEIRTAASLQTVPVGEFFRTPDLHDRSVRICLMRDGELLDQIAVSA